MADVNSRLRRMTHRTKRLNRAGRRGARVDEPSAGFSKPHARLIKVRERIDPLARSPLVHLVVRRLLFAVPLVMCVITLTFGLLALGEGSLNGKLRVNYPPSVVRVIRHDLGLDVPFWPRYGRWLFHALHGNLGSSLFGYGEVNKVILDRFPVTLSLVVTSTLVISLIGVGLGVAGAIRGGFIARLLDGLALLGFAAPGFWVGGTLIWGFAVGKRWFPASGYVPLTHSGVGWARALVLPVVALSIGAVAHIAKLTREAVADALASDYVLMARASGLSRRVIFLRFALKNAMINVTTVLGLLAVGLLVGTAFIESVFTLPGLGYTLVRATSSSDYPVVLGIVFFYTILVVLLNLAIDMIYMLLDPRIRIS
jgi:peptide/nickel transport system permease protein